MFMVLNTRALADRFGGQCKIDPESGNIHTHIPQERFDGGPKLLTSEARDILRDADEVLAEAYFDMVERKYNQALVVATLTIPPRDSDNVKPPMTPSIHRSKNLRPRS